MILDEAEEMMVAMTTVEPDSVLEGCAISEVEQQLDLSIILLRRQDTLNRHPDPDLTLQADDRLVVCASLDALGQLGKMNSRACEVPQKRSEHGGKRPRLARLLSRVLDSD